MFLINSRNHRFFATSPSSHRKDVHQKRHTFSRSYGINLPSSFTRVFSSALVFSTCLPVSVCGTVWDLQRLVAFPGSLASTTSPDKSESSSRLRIMNNRICLVALPTRLNQPIQQLASLAFSVPTSLQSPSTGILTCFPSTTLLSLALGADSPCADYRGAGNLGLPACGFFTRIIVTHVSIRASDTSSNLLKSPSTAYRTLLYRPEDGRLKTEDRKK